MLRTRYSLSIAFFVSSCQGLGEGPSDPTDSGSTALTADDTSDLTSTGATSGTSTPITGTTLFETATSVTGDLSRCDEDQQCDPGEDVFTCPGDCNICGDSFIFGGEACDNGINVDGFYSMFRPPETTCTPDCQKVAFCGDLIRNGPELCDDGAVQTASCEADCRFPVCGDNVHNVLAGEGCDDADLVVGDGCSPDCVTERRVFATSAMYHGNLDQKNDNPGFLHGLELADFRCNTLAAGAGLPGNYKAWLSDDDSSPATRFDTSFSGRYRLVSAGFPIIAHAWQDLIDSHLDHPINADETGKPVLGNAWTNTFPNGTQITPTDHCKNWTYINELGELYTTIGWTAVEDYKWSMVSTSSVCSNIQHLYCFEDP